MSRRGGGGHGGGHDGMHRGPQLPWSLQKEVAGPDGVAGLNRGDRGGFHGRGGRGGRGHSGAGGRGRFGSGRGGGPASSKPATRKDLRKAARQGKKHQRFEHQQQHAQQRHSVVAATQQQQQHAGSKRQRQEVPPAAAAMQRPAKKQRPHEAQPRHRPQQQQQQQGRREQQQPPPHAKPAKRSAVAAAAAAGGAGGIAAAGSEGGEPRTRFYHMLADQGVPLPSAGAGAGVGAGGGGGGSSKHAAFLADLRLERELAKKLGLKKRSKHSGPEDGLDTLLSGITTLLPSELQRRPKAGGSALDAAAAAAAAGLDDDDDGEGEGPDGGQPLGSDFDESSGSEQDEGEDESSGDESGDPFGLAGFGGDSDSLLGEDESSLSGGVDDDEEDEEDEEEGKGGQGLSSGSLDGSGSDLQGGDAAGSGSSSDGEDDEGPDGSSDAGDLLSSEPGDGARAGAAAAAPAPAAANRAKAAALAPEAAAAGAAKYVPPALRRAQEAAAAAGAGSGGSGGLPAAVQRRVTGLLNKLAEANLQAIVQEIVGVYETQGRRAVAEAVSAGLLAAVAEGPRATEQFAAVVAVFVAGLAASARAQDISARFLELLAARLEQAYAAEDGLACHNLIMLLAYCYSAGVMAADCMYSVLAELTRRFTESDVAMMLTLLNAVGLQLRSADPAAMKDFVLAVHSRAAVAGQAGGMTKRAEIMLELVMDIKNNRLRDAAASRAAAAAAAAGGGERGRRAASSRAVAAAGRGGAAAVLQPGLLKWLKASGVDDVALGNISWAKLVQPDKKGMWWHPSATDAAAGLLPSVLADTPGGGSAAALAAAAAAIDADFGPDAGPAGAGAVVGGAQLLQLAAGLRMSTDVRRAVFVAIMGSEDCAEACEKLLRLPLKGDQSREVVRVLVECCLQEQQYNPYYGHLAARLAAVSKGDKVTLQYCLWDQWKAVATTEPRRLLCLAGFVGHLLSGCVLPLSTIKPVDFDAAATWTSRETFLWRHTLHKALAGFASDAECEAALARLTQNAALGPLCRGLGMFLRLRLGPWLVVQGDSGALAAPAVEACLRRLARAEKLLLSSQGAVLAG